MTNSYLNCIIITTDKTQGIFSQEELQMTNFEKYHKEMIKHGYTAVRNGRPTTCQILCSKCDLYRDDMGCLFPLLLWLADEYKEPKPKPTLTEKEMHLCKAFNSGYIVRDANGSLFFHTSKPEKSVNIWCDGEDVATYLPPNSWFSFIKWEDKEPHSIEEMLTWEVENE